MYNIRGYYDRGKIVVNLVPTWNSFIGQFVHPIEGFGRGGIVNLALCKFHFIVEHENLMQDPSNNISIPTASVQTTRITKYMRRNAYEVTLSKIL